MSAENPGFNPEELSNPTEGVDVSSNPGTLNRRQVVVGAAATAAGLAMGVDRSEASAHEGGQATAEEQNIVLGHEDASVNIVESQEAREAWGRIQERIEQLPVDLYRVNSAFNQNNPEAQGPGYHITAPEQALHLYQNGDHYELSYEYIAQPDDPMALHIEAFAIYRSQEDFNQQRSVVIRSGSEFISLSDDPDVEAVLAGRDFYVVQALMTEGHENWISVATSDPQNIEVKDLPKGGPVGDNLQETGETKLQEATQANPALAKDEYRKEQAQSLQDLGQARPELQSSEPTYEPESINRPLNPDIGPLAPEPNFVPQPEVVQPQVASVEASQAVEVQPVRNPDIGPLAPEVNSVVSDITNNDNSNSSNLLNTVEKVAPAVVAAAASGELAKRVGLRDRIASFFKSRDQQPPAQPELKPGTGF